MNLGTSSGPDIASKDEAVIAEAFAATSMDSNRKLDRDASRLAKVKAAKKYIFYHTPLPDRRDQLGDVRLIHISRLMMEEFVRTKNRPADMIPLPTYPMGAPMVDIANHAALFDLFDEEELPKLKWSPARREDLS